MKPKKEIFNNNWIFTLTIIEIIFKSSLCFHSKVFPILLCQNQNNKHLIPNRFYFFDSFYYFIFINHHLTIQFFTIICLFLSIVITLLVLFFIEPTALDFMFKLTHYFNSFKYLNHVFTVIEFVMYPQFVLFDCFRIINFL